MKRRVDLLQRKPDLGQTVSGDLTAIFHITACSTKVQLPAKCPPVPSGSLYMLCSKSVDRTKKSACRKNNSTGKVILRQSKFYPLP